jgi:hypothetical protein
MTASWGGFGGKTGVLRADFDPPKKKYFLRWTACHLRVCARLLFEKRERDWRERESLRALGTQNLVFALKTPRLG